MEAPMVIRTRTCDRGTREDRMRGCDDRRGGRHDRGLSDHNGGRRHDRGLSDDNGGGRHDRGLGDHNGVRGDDVVR